MTKRKRKTRKMRRQDIIVGAVVTLVILLLVYVFVISDPSDPGTVNIGTEIPAQADSEGTCTAREGIEMGLCCAVWNPDIGDIEWVICEDYVKEDIVEDTQALFRFENAADQLQNQAVIDYVVRIKNVGNTAAEVRIADVETTSDSGDAVSEQEFTDAFLALGNNWIYVEEGEYVDYSMSCPNVIRLDLPAASSSCGVDAFIMEDGTYITTITIEFRDPISKAVVGTEQRTVTQEVTQEVISFNIDITT